MSKKHKTTADGVRRVDFTELCSFILCKRKWYTRHILNLIPRTPRPPLSFGVALHEAWDTMYQTEFDFDAVMARWKELEFEEDVKRTKFTGELILKAYYKKYKDQCSYMKAIHHEVIWELPFNQLVLCGRMDRIVEWQGGLWVMDHKTTSRLGASYFEQYNPHAQVTMYLYAAQQYFGVEKVRGFIVDAAFVGKSNKNQRDIITMTQVEIDERMDEILTHAYELITVEKALEQKPEAWKTICPRAMITEACSAWGACEYRDLCRYGFDPKFMKTQFKEDFWTPAGGSADVPLEVDKKHE